jgi:hypothetical protein
MFFYTIAYSKVADYGYYVVNAWLNCYSFLQIVFFINNSLLYQRNLFCLIFQLCKYGRQNKREYYYTLGFHGDAEFVAQNDGNNTNVLIYYDGFR